MRRRALLAGAGGWGRVWGRTLVECAAAEMVGWVDVRPGAAAEAAGAIGVDGVYTGADLSEAIDSCRPDFLVNATLPSAHCEVSIAALDAALPVLCEKPMAATMEEAHRMIAAAERAGRLLMISQQRTHDSRLIAMRRLIDDEIGPLGILSADFYLNHPEPAYHFGLRNALLFDMAVHTFDAARFLSQSDPVAVYCDDFNPKWSRHASNASAMAIFEMSHGLRFGYHGSWCSHGWPTTWECEWRAVGPEGTVLWDGRGTPEAEIVVRQDDSSTRRRVLAETDSHAPAGLMAPLVAFLAALDTGSVPVGECHDNIKTLAMVLGAIESATTGRRVSL